MVQIALLAAEIRRRARQRNPAYSTHDLVRAAVPGALVTGRDLPAGVSALATIATGGALIVYSRLISYAAQRLAIAHEVGHLLFDAYIMRSSNGLVTDPLREDRADRFAAELLVPLEALRPLVRSWPPRARRPSIVRHDHLDHVDEIAAKFAVPPALISARIRQLMSHVKSA